MNYTIDLKCLKFLTNIANATNVFLNVLFSLNGTTSIKNVCDKYNTNKMDLISVKNAMWNVFIQVNMLNF